MHTDEEMGAGVGGCGGFGNGHSLRKGDGYAVRFVRRSRKRGARQWTLYDTRCNEAVIHAPNQAFEHRIGVQCPEKIAFIHQPNLLLGMCHAQVLV